MDPVTHTLVGASLAETGFRAWTRGATAALLIGANAPDIDAVAMFVDRDTSLGFRRGWTHGVLAMAVLPLAVVGVVWLFDWCRRRRTPSPPIATHRLLAIAYLAVLSHPALDWLNTYGIRLLAPFDDRWFYGDALFIVDPWLWLLGAAPVVLARSSSVAGAGGWMLLGAALSWLVLTNAAWRQDRVDTRSRHHCRSARVGWTGASSFTGRQGVRPRDGRLRGRDDCDESDHARTGATVAGRPGAHRHGDHGRAGGRQSHAARRHRGQPRSLLLPDRRLAGRGNDPSERSVDIQKSHERTRACCLEAPHIQGTLRWLRFPQYEVEAVRDGYRVSIRDIRFARRASAGLGAVQVDLDRALTVRSRGRNPAGR